MSGDSALVERMSNAVRAAFKAMEVLKDENRALKDENENLRKQLLELQSGVASAPRSDPVSIPIITEVPLVSSQRSLEPNVPITTPQVKPAESKTSTIQKQSTSGNVAPAQASIVAKPGKEVGNSKFSFRSFLNAPDAKRFADHLKNLQLDNVHFIASSMKHQSTDTVCKALVLTITSYLQSVDIDKWRFALTHESQSQLIPHAILAKLDLLVAMLVSMGSRGADGLVQVMALLQVLEKVVLGAVRYQLRAPHYAVVMGALRVPRDVYHAEPRKETPPVKAQSLPNAADNEAMKEAEESAPIATAEALPDTEESKKKRIAAIASMFGLDSSSSEGDSGSDSDGEGGGGSHGSVGEEGSGALGKRSRGNSLSSSSGGNPNESENELDEEDGNLEGDAAMEVDGALEKDADGADGVDKADVQHAPGSRNKAKAALVDPLELSCRVYVLLATLVRLRANAAVHLLLDHIALVTTCNVCDGCIVGVLAVLASRRFNALHCAETKVRFARLVDSWRRSLREMATGDSVVPEADALAQLKRCEALMTHCGVDASVDNEPRSTTPCPLDGAREALMSAWTVAEVGLPAVIRAARQMGFWGAVFHLRTAKTADDPFSVLGLNHAAEQAAAWVELLQDWHPVQDSKVKDGDASVSAVRLLQSDHFILSDAQERTAAALREAGMAPQKYIAQELLVEVFAKKWSRCLLQSSQDKEGRKKVVRDITRALQMTRAILQSAFETEYEAAEGGWRSGLSGDGFRLASRLDNRVTVGIALLNKLPFAGHFVSSALGAALKPPLQWQHFSSCSGRKLTEYAEFVDHCARRVFEEYTAAGDSAESEGADAETRTTVNKLYAVCAEVVALLALSGVENIAGVMASSLRGLLRCAYNMPSTSTVDGSAMVELVAEIDRTLSVIPSPWAGAGRADVQCELSRCVRTTLRRFPHTPHVPQSGSHSQLAARALITAKPMPVFLINLDKRVDRLRRSLVMLAQANIAAVRIQAFDGTGDTAASAAEMFQRNFGGAGGGGGLVSPSGGSGGGGAQEVTVRREDDYADIPERDVRLTWDSTVNSKFDARCAPNPAVIATASERACAASHLKAWRTIASICGIRPSQKNARLGELTATDAGKGPTPTEIFATLRGTPVGDSAALHKGPFAEYFAESGDDEEFFIVLEDDVCFPQQSLVDLRASIRKLVKSLPADVDILYLGGLLPKAAPDFHLQHKKKEPFYTVNYVWTLQAYVLRRRAVEVLLSKLPICAPVDTFVAGLIYAGELKACIAKDKLTQRVAPIGSGPLRNDSDVRPSGRSYDPSRKRAPQPDTFKNAQKGGAGGKFQRRK